MSGYSSWPGVSWVGGAMLSFEVRVQRAEAVSVATIAATRASSVMRIPDRVLCDIPFCCSCSFHGLVARVYFLSCAPIVFCWRVMVIRTVKLMVGSDVIMPLSLNCLMRSK